MQRVDGERVALTYLVAWRGILEWSGEEERVSVELQLSGVGSREGAGTAPSVLARVTVVVLKQERRG